MSNLMVALLTAGVMCIIFGAIVFLVVRHMGKNIDGYLDVSMRDSSRLFQVDIRTDPDEMRKQKIILLKVRRVNDL